MKILLVDDDPVFQDILTQSLRALGHEDLTPHFPSKALISLS